MWKIGNSRKQKYTVTESFYTIGKGRCHSPVETERFLDKIVRLRLITANKIKGTIFGSSSV